MKTKSNKQAGRLLHGKEEGFLYGDVGITRWEEVRGTVTHKRLLEFIESYPVAEIVIDSNSYGEFQFINLKVTRYCYDGASYEDCLTFYGSGYHEYKDTLQVNWSFHCGNGFLVKNKPAMSKKEAIRQIESRRVDMGISKDAKQEFSGNAFELLADVSDEDSALTMIQDCNLLE